jgi:hypothetical protein
MHSFKITKVRSDPGLKDNGSGMAVYGIDLAH